jgi:hypothetical protein
MKRSVIICIQGDQTKEDDLGEAHDTVGGEAGFGWKS